MPFSTTDVVVFTHLWFAFWFRIAWLSAHFCWFTVGSGYTCHRGACRAHCYPSFTRSSTFALRSLVSRRFSLRIFYVLRFVMPCLHAFHLPVLRYATTTFDLVGLGYPLTTTCCYVHLPAVLYRLQTFFRSRLPSFLLVCLPVILHTTRSPSRFLSRTAHTCTTTVTCATPFPPVRSFYLTTHLYYYYCLCCVPILCLPFTYLSHMAFLVVFGSAHTHATACCSSLLLHLPPTHPLRYLPFSTYLPFCTPCILHGHACHTCPLPHTTYLP